MKKIMLILAFLFSFSTAGELTLDPGMYQRLGEPVFLALDYLDNSLSLLSWADSLPMLGTYTKIVESKILEMMGVKDMNPGVPNLETYSKIKLERTGFRIMEESWKELLLAKEDLNRNPRSSAEHLRKAFRLAMDAYSNEASNLAEDISNADLMGIDQASYDGYGGRIYEDAWTKSNEALEKLRRTYLVYQEKKLEEMREEREKTIENLEEKINKFTEDPLSAEKLVDTIITLVDALHSILYLADYYNTLFSGNSVYTDILVTRGKLKVAMETMRSDWKERLNDFNSIDVERPNLVLARDRVSVIMRIDEDPGQYIKEGDKLLKSASQEQETAKSLAESKRDNYLYLAIRKIKSAISKKLLAVKAYKMAKKIEDHWKSQISEYCSKDISPRSDIAFKYYMEGKKMCDSNKWETKLEGAIRIKWSIEADNDPSETIASVKAMLKYVEDLVARAEKDGINTVRERTFLEGLKDELLKLENGDLGPDVIYPRLEYISSTLGIIKESILEKLRDKFSNLETMKASLEALGELAGDEWQEYSSFFNKDSLDLESAAGKLSEMEATFKASLERVNKSFDVEVRLENESVKCNKPELLDLLVTIRNPLPVNNSGTVSLGREKLAIKLGPMETRTLRVTRTDTVAKCEIEKTVKTKDGIMFIVHIIPRYQIRKLYLPISGKLVRGINAYQDQNGIFTKDIYKELSITLVVSNATQVKEKSAINNISRIEIEEIKSDKPVEEEKNHLDLNEYKLWLKRIKKNEGCIPLDLEYLEENPSLDKLKLMKSSFNKLRDTAVSKINSMRVLGIDTSALEKMLNDDNLCGILATKNYKSKKNSTTGMATLNTGLLPGIALAVLLYLVVSKREKPRDRLIRILKSGK